MNIKHPKQTLRVYISCDNVADQDEVLVNGTQSCYTVY